MVRTTDYFLIIGINHRPCNSCSSVSVDIFQSQDSEFNGTGSALYGRKTLTEQESPPAWMQEAYRPRRIKYSVWYPKWGTPQQGYPPARFDRGGTQGGEPPTPSRGTVWRAPGQVWWGGSEVVPPWLDLAVVPPLAGPGWGTLSPDWSWPGYSP